MNNLIRHSILLLLAFSITLGSVGVALGQQLCQMVMVGSAEKPDKDMPGCCSKSDSSDSENDCCTLKVTYKKLDLVSTTKAELVKKLYFTAPASVVIPFRFIPADATPQNILTFTDSSPPLSGRQLLLLKQMLLI